MTGITQVVKDWLERFSRNKTRVDMTSAVAAGAGLCMTGLVLLKVSILDRVDPLDFSGIARVVFITTMPYLVAGLVIQLLWIKPLRRTIPSWIMISLLGTWFLVVSAGALRFYTNAVASNATPVTLEKIVDFIRDKATDGLGVFVVLSLFTLPITASVYYAGSIVTAIRRWHNGPEPPSIIVK